MNTKLASSVCSALLFSVLIVFLFTACNQNAEINKSLNTDEMAINNTTNKKSVFTPALKRAINSLEIEGDTLTRLSIILFVDDKAAEIEIQQLNDAGIILSQQIKNKWIIKSTISSLETLKELDWIKSADVSKTRNMK